MSYALAGLANPPIRAGELAATDPIMSYSTAFAARLMQHMVKQPKARRVAWLRSELNKAQPGMGTGVVAKANTLMALGTPRNQAILDAVRLAMANRVAAWVAKGAPGAAMAGLGESVGDLNAVFCGIMGTITVGGSLVTGVMSDPASSAAIAESGAGAMTANSCNAGALRAQGDTAVAQANAAIAAADVERSSARQSNTVLFVALGGGAIFLLFGGIILLKMK